MTQSDRISISSKPQHLLVLKLDKKGGFKEVYNGLGDKAWALVSGKKLPKN